MYNCEKKCKDLRKMESVIFIVIIENRCICLKDLLDFLHPVACPLNYWFMPFGGRGVLLGSAMDGDNFEEATLSL